MKPWFILGLRGCIHNSIDTRNVDISLFFHGYHIPSLHYGDLIGSYIHECTNGLILGKNTDVMNTYMLEHVKNDFYKKVQDYRLFMTGYTYLVKLSVPVLVVPM